MSFSHFGELINYFFNQINIERVRKSQHIFQKYMSLFI